MLVINYYGIIMLVNDINEEYKCKYCNKLNKHTNSGIQKSYDSKFQKVNTVIIAENELAFNFNKICNPTLSLMSTFIVFISFYLRALSSFNYFNPIHTSTNDINP